MTSKKKSYSVPHVLYVNYIFYFAEHICIWKLMCAAEVRFN